MLDRIAVTEAYARTNHLWKIHGLAAIATLYGPPHLRAEPMGMEHAEVQRVVAGIRTFYAGGKGHDWIEEWSRAGGEYLERARAAVAKGRLETAGDLYLVATASYFCAAFIVFDLQELPVREAAHRRAVEAYREGALYYRPPAKRVDVPFDGATLPGYLRVPDGTTRPPCVIMVGGANSTKEDNHPIADYFLRRGMAVFLYDGPGQGEYLQTSGKHLRVREYDRSVTAAVDWLVADGAVDPQRIDIFGKSTGGILVLHAAATEHRLRAVVCHPASYRWAPYFDESRFPLFPRKVEMAHMLGAESIAELDALVASELTLEEVIADVRCPVLAVNGMEDLFPVTEPELIRANAKCEVEIALLPGAGHGGTAILAYPLEADWMRERLTPSP